MRKKIIVLGSTGSIGQNTIEILDQFRDEFELVGISAYSNSKILKDQLLLFDLSAVCVGSRKMYNDIENVIHNGCRVYTGSDGILEMIREFDADIVVNSIVGAAGLMPTLMAIETGKNVALANKESLVVAGELVVSKLRKYDVTIFPVDSEHSAIWQCLAGENTGNIKRIILTASGGPFLHRDINSFDSITVREALNHPNWKMGNKITIDCATLMNKGFEVIETRWLFDISVEKISVIIHPQSIIHSMVEFIDGSIKAQLGIPDMKLPIQYALTHPDRKPGFITNDSIFTANEFTFEMPDYTRFPCLKMAFQAIDAGSTAPAVLNAANEVAVDAFFQERINFTDISRVIDAALQEHESVNDPSLEDYLEADKRARKQTEKRIAANGI